MFSRFIVIIIFISSLWPKMAQAQMDIDLVETPRVRADIFRNEIKHQDIKLSYFSQAREAYERKLLRQQRNKLEISTALQGSLTNLSDSWIETSGGDNSISLLATIGISHTYTKNLFSLNSSFAAKFGYYRVVLEEDGSSGEVLRTPVWFKNQDEFNFSITPSIKMSKNWSYGATLKFRSQFQEGYVSSGSQEDYHLKSDFMSPGYLDLSGGLIYVCPKPKFPIRINISPLALAAIYVTSSQVRENSQYEYKEHLDANKKYIEPYGVSPFESSKYEGGSSIQIDFDKYFGKDNFIRYTTSIFSFYGWMTELAYENIISSPDEYEIKLKEWEADKSGVKPMLSIHPTLRWENRIEIKASKLLATTLNFQLYYNRAQNLSVQTQTLLSVGLAYKFTSK